MNQDLTLCMITKNDTDELDLLKQCIESVKDYIKYLNITVTVKEGKTPNAELENVIQMFRSDTLEVIQTEFLWCDDFSAARNFNLQHCPTELVLWLDTDDVFINPHEIPKVLKKFQENKNITSIWMWYRYDHDKDGNCINDHPRERIFKKSIHNWKGRLHENAICKYRYLGFLTDECEVKHNTDFFNIEDKAVRNFKIILEAYESELKAGKLDPRTVYDLGRTYESMSKDQEALNLFNDFMGMTDSQIDYYDALMRVINIYLKNAMPEKAREAAYIGIKTQYEWPDAYLGLAKTAFYEKFWEECIHWLDFAKELKAPIGLPQDPLKYTTKSMMLRQECLFRLGKAKESLKVIEEALEIVPSNEHLQLCKKRNIEFLNRIRLEEGLSLCIDYLQDKEPEKVESLLRAWPETAKDMRVFIKEHDKRNPVDGKDRVVIYCGDTPEEWGPKSVESGIGGSEEAVINIAKRLVKLGWKVEVYNLCKKDNHGEHEGVVWKYFDEYNPVLPCDIFIAWRMSEYIQLAPKAKVRLLWLHDKQKLDYYQPGVLDRIDKLFFLSNYHRQDLPEIPDEKVYITRNGIDPEQFDYESQPKMLKRYTPENDPNKYIYASSPDRGLEYIINNWDKIKEINPEAELHIFYGFTEVFDYLTVNDPNRRKFKEDMLQKIDKAKDVHYHGRVGHQELADWFMKCGYWFYPTDFPEISCITAMKAQAAGCWPICSDFAALKETVKYGNIVKGKPGDEGFMDKWLDTVGLFGEMPMSSVVVQEMRDWALDYFSYETLAKEWSDKFKEWRQEKETKEEVKKAS